MQAAMANLCQAEEHWIELNGARMRYLRAGCGPSLLLIHGLLGYSFSWRFNLPALAQHFTVYAPDLVGVGLSERARGLDYRLAASAERMLTFLDLLGIESVDVLGTSHGGGVAVHMAALEGARGQRRIGRLVLVAPINPWSRHGRLWAPTVASAPGRYLFRHLFSRLRPLHPLAHARMYGDRRRIPAGTAEGYLKPLRIPGTLDTLLEIAGGWNADLDSLEQAFNSAAGVPALVIWGDRDRAVTVKSAPEVGARFRSAELVVMKGAGHLPYEETPEEFNRLLLEFLLKAAA